MQKIKKIYILKKSNASVFIPNDNRKIKSLNLTGDFITVVLYSERNREITYIFYHKNDIKQMEVTPEPTNTTLKNLVF